MTERRPVIDYVTKDYEGFKQGMLGQAPLLLPEWTDRGEADFGVVLIELFAYVADILSYYQDRIANEAYLPTATQRRSVTELLRLIDYQIDPGLAAATHLHLAAQADVTVDAPSLPFAVKTAGRPGEPDVTFEITRPFALRARNSSIALAAVEALPAGATALVLDRAEHALAEGDAIYLQETTTLAGSPPRVRRSPLVEVAGVRALDASRDEIAWLPPLPDAFDPATTVLQANNVPATHGRTIADEPIVVADGTPGERMTLTRWPVTHLLREGAPVRRRSAPELEVRIDGVLWDEVESLAPSGPADLHYTTEVDENDALTVVFGSGARGAVPPAGARIAARYRVGLGVLGNVGPDSLTVAVTALPEIAAVSNPFAATGGADHESIDEARIAGPGSVIAQERAVTLQDYERLAEGFPGVGKARARVGLRGGYKVVQVYVAPEAPDTVPPALPDADLRAALAAHLEARMPVNRMAGVDVLDPVYVAVDAVVDVSVAAEASQTTVTDAVRAALSGLLSFENQDFGVPIRVGEVLATLFGIEGIGYVELRELARADSPPAGDFADVPIADHELGYEGQVTVNAFGGLR